MISALQNLWMIVFVGLNIAFSAGFTLGVVLFLLSLVIAATKRDAKLLKKISLACMGVGICGGVALQAVMMTCMLFYNIFRHR